ncbi:hypothetical protein HSBAA_44270 [Vreelandella sulfidaeris]|uniref:Glycosyl transferase family 1 domain-containing protein n=1 Tax=Vreelandella sulfidaeris TaxID=115553 RepID=A0A455UEQ0_9GAMM|nr:hypothetical protein HSBAA_44270 [Halomonas sulfidaeris]
MGPKVLELKDNAVLRQQLGKQASHFAEEFDIANFATAVAAFYAEVLAKYHSPSR